LHTGKEVIRWCRYFEPSGFLMRLSVKVSPPPILSLALIIPGFKTIPMITPASTIRATSWGYTPDVTPEAAVAKARALAAAGVNLLLTENNRYILYNPRPGTPVPHFHFVATHRRDIIASTAVVTRAMHDAGLKVIHHVTSCYASADLAALHPDWTQRDLRDPDKPLYFGDYGGVHLFCPTNPDFRHAFLDALTEITLATDVDGWMIDEVEFLPDWFSCGCVHCRAAFHATTGLTLPDPAAAARWDDFSDPLRRAFIAWRMTALADFFAAVRQRLNDIRPDSILTACHANIVDVWSAQYWGIDKIALSRPLDLIFYEAYIRAGQAARSWPRHAAEEAVYLACAHRKTLPPFTLFYPKSQPEADFCWALAASRGHGLWSWFGKPAGSMGGEHGALANARSTPDFIWQSARPQLFRRAEPHTRIALLFSKATRDMISPMDNSAYIDPWAGWATTLLEANVGFRVVLDVHLSEGALDGATLLLMPDTACLSDAAMGTITRFRDAGGAVVACGETATLDETGALRDEKQQKAFVALLDLHMPQSPGAAALRHYLRNDQPVPPQPDKEARRQILAVIEQFSASNLWRVTCKEGSVAANVLRDGTGLVTVHLVNTSGLMDAMDEMDGMDRPEGDGGKGAADIATSQTLISQSASGLTIELEFPQPPANPPQLHQVGIDAPIDCSHQWQAGRLTLQIPDVPRYAIIELTP
jgi:CheY-like chemotaxis protein